jgi:hypothetical protein
MWIRDMLLSWGWRLEVSPVHMRRFEYSCGAYMPWVHAKGVQM